MDAIKASKNIRRIITGSLVVLLLWGGTLGIVGFATAGDSTEELPSEFTLAEPRVGDRAEYTITYVRDDGGEPTVLEEERHYQTYEWLEPEIVLDADGIPRHVFRLLEQWSRIDEEGNVLSGAATHELDSTTLQYRAYVYYSESSNGETGYDGWSEERFLSGSGGQIIDCGPLNLLAGQTIDPSKGHTFYGACAWPHYWTEGVRFQGMASDVIGGVPTVYFERVDRHNEDQDIHLWLSEEVSFPMRIAHEDQNAADHFSVLRLSSFTRGDEPMVPAPVTRAPAAPVKTVPPTDLILDDSGIDHPFPMSQAFQVSMEHEDAQALRDFMDDDGWLLYADYSFQERDDVQDHQWAFQAARGDQTYAWLMTARVTPTVDHWMLLMPEEAPRETTYIFEDDRFSRSGGGLLPSGDVLPAEVPTVASLMSLWAAHRDDRLDEESSDRYGFSVGCNHDCSVVSVSSWAGVDRRSSSSGTAWYMPVGGTPQTQDGAAGQLHYGIGSDGSRSVKTYQYAYEFDHGDVGPAPTSDNSDMAVASVAYDTELWGFPASAAIAGAGLFSFAIGALYFAWPAIKSGLATALFSRVTEPSKLLEHPVRRRIHDLVTAQPGIHLREVQRQADIGRGALEHHVRKLCDVGVLKRVKSTGHICLFLHGATDHAVMEVAPAVRAKSAQAILGAAAAQPGTSLSDLAKTTGLAVATVHHHVKRLESVGALDIQRAGSKVQVFVTPTGQKAQAVAA